MARLGFAAGRLRHEIVIQSSTPTQNSAGEPIDSWSTFATVRAERRPVSARERIAAGGEQAVAEFVFLIRYLSGLTAKMRISFEGVTYDITGIVPYGDAPTIGHEIMARKRVD